MLRLRIVAASAALVAFATTQAHRARRGAKLALGLARAHPDRWPTIAYNLTMLSMVGLLTFAAKPVYAASLQPTYSAKGYGQGPWHRDGQDGVGLLQMLGFMAGSIKYLDNSSLSTSIIPTAATNNGQRLFTDLDNGKSNRFIDVQLFATVTFAGIPATSIINNGMVEALFSEIGISEAGTDQVVMDPRAAFHASEFYKPRATTRTLLTSTAVASTALTSRLRIWFESPTSVVPGETAFLEKSLQQRLRFFIRQSTVTTGNAASSPGAGSICTAAAGCTVTFTAMEVRVIQAADLGAGSLPLFRPKVDQIIFTPAAASAAFRCDIPLDNNQYLRAVTILADSTGGLVAGGFLNQLQFRGDRFEYIGQGGTLPVLTLASDQEYDAGGDVFTTAQGSMLHWNFQKYGRLASIVNPAQDTNFRFNMGVGAPPAGGQLILVRHMLVRDTYVGPDGRRVCAESLPVDLAA